MKRRFLAGITAAGLLASGLPAHADTQPFLAFIDPDISTVEVDSSFVVAFRVGDPAEHFNGYEVTIQFDPAILEFEGVQEGSLMTEASPNRFTFPTETDSTITYAHVILAAGVSVSGPGELSRYRFRSLVEGTSLLEIVSDPACTFLDAGICVNADSAQALPREVTMEDGVVIVTDGATASPEFGVGPEIRFELHPNPTRAGGDFRFSVVRGGTVRIDVFDVTGRSVYRGAPREVEAGTARVVWSGRGGDGAPLAPGVYFARLSEAAGTRTTRFVVLR